jgi:hypothetical protein
MTKLDKQIKKLNQFLDQIKKGIKEIEVIQIKDLEEISKYQDKVIKTIFSLEEMFDFDFTREQLLENNLEENIKLLNELIGSVEEMYGLEKSNSLENEN